MSAVLLGVAQEVTRASVAEGNAWRTERMDSALVGTPVRNAGELEYQVGAFKTG